MIILYIADIMAVDNRLYKFFNIVTPSAEDKPNVFMCTVLQIKQGFAEWIFSKQDVQKKNIG